MLIVARRHHLRIFHVSVGNFVDPELSRVEDFVDPVDIVAVEPKFGTLDPCVV